MVVSAWAPKMSDTKQNESGTFAHDFFLRGEGDLLEQICPCCPSSSSRLKHGAGEQNSICFMQMSQSLLCYCDWNHQCKLIATPTVLLKLKSVY